MSELVTFCDNTGDHVIATVLMPVPHVGEHVSIDGKQYGVTKVRYVVSRGQCNFVYVLLSDFTV